MALPITDESVQLRLSDVLSEIIAQSRVGETYPTSCQSFNDEMSQILEYISVGEYSIAYECIVANLEKFPFTLSGPTAIKLLEVGLRMGYKTDRPEDEAFDMRR